MSVQSCVDQKCFSFLPTGRTGVGKSTFINSICNSDYFKTSSLAKSCTKEVSCNQFQVDDEIFLPIDVPGLYDSNGIDEDQKNMQSLVDFLKKYDHGLNGIGLVISYSDHRLDTITKKIIKLLYQFIGDDKLWSHFCVIVTHCPPYHEEIEKLKKTMTHDKDSLRASIINLIKGISHIKEEPHVPFFFVDSMHPKCSPSRETLPQFKEWLFSLSSIKTTDLREPDVKYQYKENRCRTEVLYGQMKPIYKYERGESKWITVTESVPYVENEIRYITKIRQVEYWGERDWDAGDIFSFGIARAFRDNRKKCTRWETYKEPYEHPVTKYRERERVVEKPGDLQYVIKGYYQEVKKVTKSWIAYWNYEVDIIEKNNPTYEADFDINTETKIEYFDNRKNRLSSYYNYSEIWELKRLI